MTKKTYPLTPSHAEPYYVQLTKDEYDHLLRATALLNELLQGNAEINTLTSEVKALREMNAKAQEEIATLKENQRWRKCSEELPEEGVEVLVTNGVDCSISDWCGDYWNNDPFCGFTVSDNVIAWMPLPLEPKDK